MIAEHLMDYLDEHQLLSHHQFGFWRGRSTVEQLLLVYDDVCEVIDSGKTVELVMFDYSKAFDKTCHPIFLTELKFIGMNGSLLKWISSF